MRTRWDVVEGLGLLSLDAPPGNALPDPEFMPLDELKSRTADEGLRGLVITGAGRHFSSGADEEKLFAAARDRDALVSRVAAGRALLDHLADLPVPTVAAVRGLCFGGGLEIALACHFRFCGERSLFAFPEANLALIPGLNGPWRLAELVGRAAALDILLSGDSLNASRARDIGLVDRVVPGKTVADDALAFLDELTRERPLAVIRGIVSSVNAVGRRSLEESMDAESRIFCELAAAEAARRRLAEDAE